MSADPFGAGGTEALVLKLRSLGVNQEEELQALLSLVKIKRHVGRGEDIVHAEDLPSHLTVLVKGLACRYKMFENGRRQIFTFQYPGDFCDLDRYILREAQDAVGALADCTVGMISHEDVRTTMARYPRLGVVLWRATMIEAGIFRERLVNVSQRLALPRVANLLAEQVARLDTIGIRNAVMPMTQVDLADAASLSAVHVNRTVHDLRELGALSKNTHALEVACRDRLMDVGKFDGRYLTASQILPANRHSSPAHAECFRPDLIANPIAREYSNFATSGNS